MGDRVYVTFEPRLCVDGLLLASVISKGREVGPKTLLKRQQIVVTATTTTITGTTTLTTNDDESLRKAQYAA